jgi:hypothetical protein
MDKTGIRKMGNGSKPLKRNGRHEETRTPDLQKCVNLLIVLFPIDLLPIQHRVIVHPVGRAPFGPDTRACRILPACCTR